MPAGREPAKPEFPVRPISRRLAIPTISAGTGPDRFQGREVAELRWNRAAEVVAAEIELLEVGEATQFGRDRAYHLLEGQIQFDNPAQMIDAHADPFLQWRVGEPVQVEPPIGSSRRVIQRDQDLAVRQRWASVPGALMRWNALQPLLKPFLSRRAQLCIRVVQFPHWESGQGRWESPREVVAADPQLVHPVQQAQTGREPPGQPVACQIEGGYAANGIGCDSVPLIQCACRPPVGSGPS